MTTLLVQVLAFLAGATAGAFFREGFELIHRKDDPSNLSLWFRVHRTDVLAGALIVSMLLTSLVGVLVIVNNHERSQLGRCLTAYNQQSGQARDDRVKAADKSQEAQIRYVRQDLRYQQGLLDSIENSRGVGHLRVVIHTKATANRAYLKKLTHQKAVQDTAEYPPSDLCEAP